MSVSGQQGKELCTSSLPVSFSIESCLPANPRHKRATGWVVLTTSLSSIPNRSGCWYQPTVTHKLRGAVVGVLGPAGAVAQQLFLCCGGTTFCSCYSSCLKIMHPRAEGGKLQAPGCMRSSDPSWCTMAGRHCCGFSGTWVA